MLTRLWPEDVLCRFVTLPPSLLVVRRKATQQQLTLKELSLKTLPRVSTVCHFVTCLQSARILHHRRCPLSHLLEVAVCCRGGPEVKNNKITLSLFSHRSLLLDLKDADLKRYVAAIARCFPETTPLRSPKC